MIRVQNGAAEWIDVKKGASVQDLIEVYGPYRAETRLYAGQAKKSVQERC